MQAIRWGVFPKDIYGLLFRYYFDLKTAIKCVTACEAFGDFLTDEQRSLYEVVMTARREQVKRMAHITEDGSGDVAIFAEKRYNGDTSANISDSALSGPASIIRNARIAAVSFLNFLGTATITSVVLS